MDGLLLKLTLGSSNEPKDSPAIQMYKIKKWSLTFALIHEQKSMLVTQVSSIVAFGGICWHPFLHTQAQGGTISKRCRL